MLHLVKAALPELGWGPQIATGLELYVATTGVDTNDGTKDKPYKTILKAQTVIRSMKTANTIPADGVTVGFEAADTKLHPYRLQQLIMERLINRLFIVLIPANRSLFLQESRLRHQTGSH